MSQNVNSIMDLVNPVMQKLEVFNAGASHQAEDVRQWNNMREDQHQFMWLLNQLPAHLTVEQTAWVINCQPSDVPILAPRDCSNRWAIHYQERKVFCRVGIAGTSPRPDVADEGHECSEPALAEKKCRKDEWPFLLSWPSLDGREIIFAISASRVAFNSDWLNCYKRILMRYYVVFPLNEA